MEKKSILFLLILALIMPCVFLLSACGEQGGENQTKETQTSNLAIESVYQNAYGYIKIEFENAQLYMNAENRDSAIEVSCDNGTTWANYHPETFVDITNYNLGNILYYEKSSDKFISATSGESESYSVGTSITVVARLMETDTKNASNSTTPYNCLLKSLQSNSQTFGNCSETALTGSLINEAYALIGDEQIDYDGRFQHSDGFEICTNDYVLYKNGEIIKIGSVSIDETTYTITPCTNYGDFEYRFYAGDENDLTPVMNGYDNYNNDSANWNTLTSEGINYNEDDTVIINDGESSITFLKILIRFKETSATGASICYYNFFIISTVEV